MRILQIRFKNLNSLVGEWVIDLTHPSYVADGIFAITGPTGAGKTTILDAICLALYARTPRLDKVNKSGNEILSRQTGECYAEVTFETGAGRYRCHWSQHRARKKPDGERQAPRHEIVQADSGEIIEAKVQGVAKQIEMVTGMDFDRFTRSMLLAQGGFAAFLQAASDERAPILEQITGTGIYSQLSMRVHARYADEHKILDQRQAELAGVQPLPPEEVQELNTELERKTLQEAGLAQQLVQHNRAFAWLEGLVRIETELTELGQQKIGWQRRMEAGAVERERLGRASRALELAGEQAALTSLRLAQAEDRRVLDGCRSSLSGCEQGVARAAAGWQAATARFEECKAAQQRALPVLRAVRELDLKLTALDAVLQTGAETMAAHEQSLERLRTQRTVDGKALDDDRHALASVTRLLEESTADQGLLEHLAGLHERCDAWRKLHRQVDDQREELQQTDGQLAAALQLCQQRAASLAEGMGRRDELQDRLTNQQGALERLLAGRELADWRGEVAALTARKGFLAEAVKTVQSLSRLRLALAELGQRMTALGVRRDELVLWFDGHAQKQAGFEQERDLLETQLTLLRRIEDLQEARHQLQDGAPCPLCGAKEHPFAAGNVPVPDETQQRLNTVKADLKTVAGEATQWRVELAKVDKERELVAAGLQDRAGEIEEAEGRLAQYCTELALEAADPGLEAQLERIRGEIGRALERSVGMVQSGEEMEQELGRLRASLEEAKDRVAARDGETQAAVQQRELIQQRKQQLEKDAEARRSQQAQALGSLQQEVQVYGIDSLSIDNVEQMQRQLTTRRDLRKARQRQQSELEPRIAALATQVRHQEEGIRLAERELTQQRHQRDGLSQERTALINERRRLFADQDADEEEARLAVALDAAEQALESARQQLTTANQQQGELNARRELLVGSLAQRQSALNASAASFLARCQQAGFASEERYQEACLPEDERNSLAQRFQQLDDEKTGLTSKERTLLDKLAKERQQPLTELSLQELDQARTQLAADQKALQQALGAIRQRLGDNDQLMQKQQGRLQACEAQQRECARWDLLHTLIGSADGKKYRNFAQGLTFAVMIGHANRQLLKMTDRYLLSRNESQPLELNVIDNYQAGEVRSTKNLSGGESFIVSLSLALGLSNMASNNVRVDSLFLDEGFGTLDEEALDTALETLAGLRQEGKLIGIISHVSALKERINTQIQVMPQSGGRSLLTGPGCRRIVAGA